jgi:hypothetical protein
VCHSGLLSSDILQLPPISKLDILKHIGHLRPSKSVGLDGVPHFIIMDRATVFAQLFKCIFDLSLLWENFPTQWEKR